MSRRERFAHEIMLKQERIALWERHHEVPVTLDQFEEDVFV